MTGRTVVTFTGDDLKDHRLQLAANWYAENPDYVGVGDPSDLGAITYVRKDDLERVERDIVRRQALAILIPNYGKETP